MYEDCGSCFLRKGNKIKPLESISAKYLLFFEYPIKESQDQFNLVLRLLMEQGYSKDQFIWMGAVQCLPQYNRRGKLTRPAKSHRLCCKTNVDQIISKYKPVKGICFGDIAMEELTGTFKGIDKLHGTSTRVRVNGVVFPMILSMTPFSSKITLDNMKQVVSSFKRLNGRPI